MHLYIIICIYILLLTPDPGQETKAKMVWSCLKVFWFSKDNPTGHSERKKKKRQTEEEVGRQYQRVDRNGLGNVDCNKNYIGHEPDMVYPPPPSPGGVL